MEDEAAPKPKLLVEAGDAVEDEAAPKAKLLDDGDDDAPNDVAVAVNELCTAAKDGVEDVGTAAVSKAEPKAGAAGDGAPSTCSHWPLPPPAGFWITHSLSPIRSQV